MTSYIELTLIRITNKFDLDGRRHFDRYKETLYGSLKAIYSIIIQIFLWQLLDLHDKQALFAKAKYQCIILKSS